MSTAKVIQIIASSPNSFDDAVRQGVAQAAKSLHGLSGVEVVKWTADVKNDQPTSYKVTLNVAFELDEK
jgi:flavin-binding protein dodecin